MKRLVYLACLLALLSGCCVKEQTPTVPGSGIYQLTFKAKKLCNDRVGNDWTITYIHNGQTVESGHTITRSLEVFTFQKSILEFGK